MSVRMCVLGRVGETKNGIYELKDYVEQRPFQVVYRHSVPLGEKKKKKMEIYRRGLNAVYKH